MDHLSKDQIAAMTIEQRADRLFLLAQIVNPPDTPEMLAEINALLSVPAKPAISGYRELTADEVKLINITKENAALVGELCEGIAGMKDVYKRWAAIAKTNLQQGFMALVRAIARPEGL